MSKGDTRGKRMQEVDKKQARIKDVKKWVWKL